MIATTPTLQPTLREAVQQPLPDSAHAPTSVPHPTLAEALQAIRQDSLVQPQLYLDEVRVPFGGE
jgi:hypothetical protein